MNIRDFLTKTIAGELSTEQQMQFLRKPIQEISVKELADAVEYLLSVMETPPNLPGAIDMAGTGGSGLDTINTSTVAAFILAGAGVKVAKHGNRSASGTCGSFDVLEALGVPIELDAEELQARFRENNSAFLFARSYHPVLRHFAEARSNIGIRTFFNFLGPLLSPVKAQRQVIGVYDASIMRMVAEISLHLGREHVLVVHGSDGLDEVTVTGTTKVVELRDGAITEYEISPRDFGITKVYKPADIIGGDITKNVSIVESLLNNTGSEAHRDLVLVNAAVGLYIAGMTGDLNRAFKDAKNVLVSGKAQEVLSAYKAPAILRSIVSAREKDMDFKAGDISQRSDLRRYAGGLIAEVKKKSPSQGIFVRNMDVVAQAKVYESAGASAVSVVTEPHRFGGSLADIKTIRTKINLPILCKDFITSLDQINAVYEAGADMVLLIAAILPAKKYLLLYRHAKSLGLQILTEVHTESELRMVSGNVEMVGINARDLNTFSINTDLFGQLRSLVPKGIPCIAESGITTFASIPDGADGWLVGTSILKHPFPKLKVKELSGRPLLKLCGIRDVESAKLCEAQGVDLMGLNFVPRSKRKITMEKAQRIRVACPDSILVGVFENMPAGKVKKHVNGIGLDAVQLCGSENTADYTGIAPIIKSQVVGQQNDPLAFLHIIDNKLGGSGEQFDHSKLEMFESSLIAGGIDLGAAEKLFKTIKPLGIDTASGIESREQISKQKITLFAELARTTLYDHSAVATTH